MLFLLLQLPYLQQPCRWMTDQQQNWSPVSHSSGGSFLKTGNYFKHFTVFESVQFCLSLHKSISVPHLPLPSSREDNFSLLSLPVMPTLKLEVGGLYCSVFKWSGKEGKSWKIFKKALVGKKQERRAPTRGAQIILINLGVLSLSNVNTFPK